MIKRKIFYILLYISILIFLFAITSLGKKDDDILSSIKADARLAINLKESPIFVNVPFVEYIDHYNVCIEGGDENYDDFPFCNYQHGSDEMQLYVLLKTYKKGYLTVRYHSFINSYLFNQSKQLISTNPNRMLINPGYYIVSLPYELETDDDESKINLNVGFDEFRKKDKTYYPLYYPGGDNFDHPYIKQIEIGIYFFPYFFQFQTIFRILGGIILLIIIFSNLSVSCKKNPRSTKLWELFLALVILAIIVL